MRRPGIFRVHDFGVLYEERGWRQRLGVLVVAVGLLFVLDVEDSSTIAAEPADIWLRNQEAFDCLEPVAAAGECLVEELGCELIELCNDQLLALKVV